MLDRLKRRLNLAATDKDALLNDLLEDARQFVLSYTGRQALPDALCGVVVEIAAGSYNLLGLEGVASHSEGGVSDTLDMLPPRLRAVLNSWRVAHVG